MTDNHPTRIVELECQECGVKKSLKVAKIDAKMGNTIGYWCADLNGPAMHGCGHVTTHKVSHIYGEPASSKLRELNYE
jgi:hypothetical protein